MELNGSILTLSYMSPRTLRTLIASVGIMASVTLVIAFLAVLPRSAHPGSTRAARGSGRSAIQAVDVAGAAQPPVTNTTSVPLTSASTAAVPSTTVSTLPSTRGTIAGHPTATHGVASTTSTTLAVAVAGPATGRLAVTMNASGSGPSGIETMAADGSDRRVLVTGAYFDPQWTPDGRFVLFDSYGADAMWAVPAEGGPLTQLGAAVAGVISPDGTRVAQDVATASGDTTLALVVQPVAETAAGLVTNGPASPLGVNGVSPVWSPDGRQILYATEMGSSSDLAVVNADGTGNRDLLGSAPVKAVGTDRPGFSPSGTTISFLGTDGYAYFIDDDGTNLRMAISGTVPGVYSFNAFATAWSPDHQDLAILLNGGNSVVVVDTSGHLVASVHLTPFGFPVGIAFDGSGRYIYYLAPAPPNLLDLYSVALSGGAGQLVGGVVGGYPVVLP